MASRAIVCDPDVLSAQQQADLVAFVEAGNKLIIFDSECYPVPVDYSWLPYPFTTANPGAMGGTGILTVVENDTLSTWVGDPDCSGDGALDCRCIDELYLGGSTDAVGDMNAMTTFDPNWFLDMAGTNAIGVTGPVQTYALVPSGVDAGLVIYNGLDQDYLYYDDAELRQMWVQLLQQPFNPSALPGAVPLVGIVLSPEFAENEVGEDHTVTAALTDLTGAPQTGVEVGFTVLSGPNAGASGACAANLDCTTDGGGEVSFTYTGSGGEGTDEIGACFLNEASVEVCALPVAKAWILLNAPPECSDAYPSQALLWGPDHRFEPIEILGVEEPDGEAVTITVTSIRQDEAVAAQGTGTTAPDGRGVGPRSPKFGPSASEATAKTFAPATDVSTTSSSWRKIRRERAARAMCSSASRTTPNRCRSRSTTGRSTTRPKSWLSRGIIHPYP